MNQERLLMVLKEPHTSEKSTLLADKNRQYTFKILNTATKAEVKHAVEKLFKVQVDNVTTTNVRGKVKRFRQQTGKRNDWKKAYVTLSEGHEIDFTVTE